MLISNAKVSEATESSTLELIKIFQRSPYNFLYESDLQAWLFSKMRSLIPESISIEGTGKPMDKYELSIVNTEYWKRIDIACLDVERVQTHPVRIHGGHDIHIHDVPILIGIEIKYRKMGDRFDLKACIADFNKLNTLQIPEPLVLGFIQSDKDIDSFFSDNLTDYTAVYVEPMEPLSTINIVSPTRRWKINAIT